MNENVSESLWKLTSPDLLVFRSVQLAKVCKTVFTYYTHSSHYSSGGSLKYRNIYFVK